MTITSTTTPTTPGIKRNLFIKILTHRYSPRQIIGSIIIFCTQNPLDSQNYSSYAYIIKLLLRERLWMITRINDNLGRMT